MNAMTLNVHILINKHSRDVQCSQCVGQV